MITFYDIDKEIYYKVYVSVIDINGEWEDYEISDLLVKKMTSSFDKQRETYNICEDFWQDFKQDLDKWIESDGYVRTYDEEKHYEIYQATPLYKVFNKCDEWCNEDWPDTLDDAKHNFLDSPFNEFEQYRIVPYLAEECEFRPKLMRWSGEI